MGAKRQQLVILAILLAVLGGAGYWFWPRSAASRPAANRASGSKGATEGQLTAPDVHLEALQSPRPQPDGAKRNLFRFKPPPAPPPPPPAPVIIRPPAPPPPPPPPPAPVVPQLPPIPLKFAGIVKQGPLTVASLIDAMGHNIYAREGQTIEGRYKLWRIGPNSIDISYLDGRGRVTIQQNGQ